ncbi:sugar transferase [Mediterraneibacter glycyrrhizinilyticus]|uniref:sugar transferase n=1 Tax=Mediterraneibacter glycyrrhizinilyticus TaxID=342942 RepID=UPI0025AA8BC1|nr:sugar transferase [Mediterraneibacter glycyrrhizinilyticus]MDN0043146.1 sugar transferase [Mediterraneibacter glycyrrhizinilyticus]
MEERKNTMNDHPYQCGQKRKYIVMKRIADICMSLAGLALFSPLLVVTAAAVKLYDGGDILYSQIRLTQDGKRFRIYKFRSMRMDSEKDGGVRLAVPDDERITPIGKVIRNRHIDELPQLFNILKGEMSMVGPRPERPEIMEMYIKEFPEFRQRLQVKAGLTGYAQVHGTYYSTPHEKLRMDMKYIEEASITEDINIILATARRLLFGEKGDREMMSVPAVPVNRKGY